MKKSLLPLLICMPAGPLFADKISIAATEWAPLTSAETGRHGLLADLAIEAFSRVGHEAEIEVMPWKRAFEMTRKGRYSGLLGTSYLLERTADFIYPQFAWNAVFHFHTRQGSRSWKYSGLKNLCPATVGVLIGSFHSQTLRNSGCLKVQENSSIRQNLRMLLTGRIDLYLNDPAVVDHYMVKDFPEAQGQIVTLQPPYLNDKVYLVFPRNKERSAALAKDYDRGIELIKADGTFDGILKKYAMSVKP